MTKHPRSARPLSPRVMRLAFFGAAFFLALPLLASISAGPLSGERLHAHVAYLASEKLAGRGSGEKGNELAARYIAEQFARVGLMPLGTSKQTDPKARMDGTGYYQPFTFRGAAAKGKKNRLAVTLGRTRVAYRAGTEFEPSPLSASGTARAEIVFAGYGIVSAEAGRDDYGSLEVRGKVVLVLDGAPAGGEALQRQGDINLKIVTARDRGAAALLVLPSTALTAFRGVDGGPQTDAGMPVLTVARAPVEAWLKHAGKSLDTVTEALAGGPQSFGTGVMADLETEVTRVTRVTANVVGMLEGSDPVLKNEVVVVGAHMDHLGMGGPWSLAQEGGPAIHFGADDNASGTAGVLGLAEHFATSARPKRSILFICFSGEERGLLGSRYYVRNPLVPLDRTVAMINMDMIGRMQNDRLIVIGTGTSPAWPSVLDEATQGSSLQVSRNDSGPGGSDHQSFYDVKVPVLFFFTGIHADYHKPSDTADKIQPESLARVVALVAATTERVANLPRRPEFQAITVAQAAPRMRARVSFGSIPDYSEDIEGVLVSGATPGSPADKAGLKAGDIIVKFGGKSVRNIQEYTQVLGEFSPGDEVEVVVKRGNDLITLKATLVPSRR